MLHAEHVYKSGPTSYFKRLSSISTQSWLKEQMKQGWWTRLLQVILTGYKLWRENKKMIWMKCSSEIVLIRNKMHI